MAKNKKMSQERFICRICGKDILGDHVIIQTKRHTTMHIHYECMRAGRKMLMREIKLFPFPHVEIRISVSDEMERDYWKCRESIRRAVEAGDDQKTFKCEECSWKNVRTSECNGVCAMNGLYEQMRGGKSDGTNREE